MLTLTKCVTEASKNDAGFSRACDQPAGLSCSSVVIKSGGPVHCPNAVSSSDNTGSADDILTNWWRSPHYSEHTKQVTSREHSSSDLNADCSAGAACNLNDSISSSSSSSQSSETGSVYYLATEPGETVESDDVYQELEMSTVESAYEQLHQPIERPVMEEYQHRKVSFPDEKLRLINKLIVSSCLQFGAEVRVKLDKHVVKISGSTADDIERTDAKLHELVVGFVTSGVDISETGAKLLSTSVGEDWLDARLAKEHLVAVFYITDAVPVIMTDCQDRLTRVKRIIESSLVTKRIQLERHHSRLLQSAIWKECIQNLHSTCLLQILDADMKLVIEGCADSAEVAVDRLNKMLGQNSRISHTVKLGCGVYQVMCFRSREMQQDAKYVACLRFCIVLLQRKYESLNVTLSIVLSILFVNINIVLYF